MRTVTPALTRAAAVGTAAAAVGVLVFTAIVNAQSGERAAPTPTRARPVTPVPASTLPGVKTPEDAPTRPITAAQKRVWLRRLAGTWSRDAKNTSFRFRADGSGAWVAFGQNLWTGTASPRDATTFDLSDPDGHGGAYWRVTLLGGGRMRFAGTGQIFRKS